MCPLSNIGNRSFGLAARFGRKSDESEAYALTANERNRKIEFGFAFGISLGQHRKNRQGKRETMGLGTEIRLSRLFSNPSGHLFGGAVDHFVGYGNVREGGLADLPGALARVMARRTGLRQHPAGRGTASVACLRGQGRAGHSGGLLYPRRPDPAAHRDAGGCGALRRRRAGRRHPGARKYGRRIHSLADRYGQRRGTLRNAGNRARLSPRFHRRHQDRVHPRRDRLRGADRPRNRRRRDQGRLHRRLRAPSGTPWRPARCRSSSLVGRRRIPCWAR